jgi:GT2 family glycosyltransferase
MCPSFIVMRAVIASYRSYYLPKAQLGHKSASAKRGLKPGINSSKLIYRDSCQLQRQPHMSLDELIPDFVWRLMKDTFDFCANNYLTS